MNKSIFKNYFLGSLNDDSAAKIELRVIEDADFAAEISVDEEYLIEDYLDNALSGEDKKRFLTNYLITEERRKNVEMTALMRQYARDNVTVSVIDSQSSKLDAGLLNWFGSLRLAAASVVLVVVMTSLWFVLGPRQDNEFLALQDRYERINQAPSSLRLDEKLSELTLVTDNLRSTGSASGLLHTELTEVVRFRLALPPQGDDPTTYDVTVFSNSTKVFQQNNIPTLSDSSGHELRLHLPRDIFHVGNYRIILTNKKTAELSYNFVVK